MKILFVLNAQRDEKAGASGAILNLGKAIEEEGHRVDYIFRQGSSSISFLIFPVKIFFLLAIRRLDIDYDIIDISSGDGFLYLFFKKMAPPNKGPRVIMRSHGLEHILWKNFIDEDAVSRIKLSSAYRIFIPLIRMREVASSIVNSDLTICLNSKEKAFIEEAFPRQIKTVAIPHGADKIFFTSSMKRGEGLLFVGDWNWRKGVRYLVEVYSRVSEKHRDVKLSIVVGKDEEKKASASFPYNLKDKIRIFKSLSKEELAGLYASCDIFIFPTLFEGFGCVILEAMASGMAVVATDDFGWNDIIRNWENGVLVQKRDVEGFSRAVIKLLEDEKLRGEIGAKAAETAKGFAWEDIARKTISSYSNLIEKYETE